MRRIATPPVAVGVSQLTLGFILMMGSFSQLVAAQASPPAKTTRKPVAAVKPDYSPYPAGPSPLACLGCRPCAHGLFLRLGDVRGHD